MTIQLYRLDSFPIDSDLIVNTFFFSCQYVTEYFIFDPDEDSGKAFHSPPVNRSSHHVSNKNKLISHIKFYGS